MAAAPAIVESLEQELKLAADERLYAVIDASQDFDLVHTARWELKCEAQSLFQGGAAENAAHVAPYLITVVNAGQLFPFWTERIGKNIGILFVSPVEPNAMLAHLREVFIITDETGQEYFFRYYDPRVLRTYVPTCTPAERTTFFGPIQRIVVENESADGYLSFAKS